VRNDYQLAEMVKEAKRVVFFGGAGVSTESGIPDFRGAEGLYVRDNPIQPETILSHTFFMRHPDLFYSFYRDKILAPDAKPNAAHTALAELEKRGKVDCVVTQNIDGLHQKAGSKCVLELHGTTLKNHCLSCGKTYPLAYILETAGVPLCGCGGVVRPDVVLYEEPLDEAVTREAVRRIQAADLLIVGGTSLQVYPAAAYVRLCPGRLVIVNRDETPYDAHADLVIRDRIGGVFKSLMEALGGV